MYHKISLVVALSLSMLGIVVLVTSILVSNQEIELRNHVEAQQVVLESEHDKMWKTLQQKAGVASEYKDTFEAIYPELISGRYNGEEGARALLFKMVQEDNPDFDTSLYVELSRAIESHRESFHMEQKKLIDLHREHKSLIETFPGNAFLADVQPVEIQTVTSSRSKKVMDLGVEDDVKLF